MYGHIAVYIGYWRFLLKNGVYSKMLRIHLFRIFTIKTSRSRPRENTDKCTLTMKKCVTMKKCAMLVNKLCDVKPEKSTIIL